MAVVGILGLAEVASAQAYSTSTMQTQITTTLADIAVVFTAVIGVTLGTWVGLAGIRYALRKFGKYFGFGSKF